MAPMSTGESDPESAPPAGIDPTDQPGRALVTTAAPAQRAGLLTGTEGRIAAASTVAGALLVLLVLVMRAGPAASPSPDVARVPVVAKTAPEVAPAAPAGPAWSDENRDTWVGGVRGAVAFEVPADRDVSVWMRTVRPTLVVRCEGKALDVFVFTDSAARIEPETEDHTVRLRVDDEAETAALWLDADTHDALFAPDGIAFARRLAAARTLHFAFTPHNAEPVTMRFTVTGLAPLLARAGKSGCKAAL